MNPGTVTSGRPMKSRSLARQTAGIVLFAQLLCAVALSGAALVQQHHTRLHAFDVQLQGRSDSLLGSIQDAEDPEDSVAVDSAELKLPRHDLWAVYDQSGKLVGRSGEVRGTLLARKEDGFRNLRDRQSSYRVLQREAVRVIDRAETGGTGLRRPVTIVYAAPDGYLWHEVIEAARLDLIVIALAAALTTGVVLVLLRRALRPLGDLAQEAGRVSMSSLNFQTPESVRQVRELRPLGQVLTEAMSSLRRSFQKEQHFFGDAAHELKTAVAVVRSSLQLLLLRERSSAEYREGIERALEDNGRVEKLIAQMLKLSTLEEATEFSPQVIDLAAAAAEVCTQLGSIADARRVKVLPDLQIASLVHLHSDRAAALISNLLLNALQHSQPGQAVTVAVARHGPKVSLRVQDTGTGIRPEALPHIFERFYREDPSRSRETGGTGLGLSICKSIADAAHGEIRVSSEPNVCTVFEVTFTQA